MVLLCLQERIFIMRLKPFNNVHNSSILQNGLGLHIFHYKQPKVLVMDFALAGNILAIFSAVCKY